MSGLEKRAVSVLILSLAPAVCSFSSIPLGRTLDFLQEDIDMMQKELVKWSEEYEKNLKTIKKHKK